MLKKILFDIKGSIRQNLIYIKLLRPFRLLVQDLLFFLKYMKNVSHKSIRTTVARNKFAGDGFLTLNYFKPNDDIKLIEARKESFESLPKDIREWNKEITYREHIVTWAANQVKDLSGDFIELGVFYGHLSHVILSHAPEILNSRKFFLIDSWGEIDKKFFINPLYNKDIFSQVQSRFSQFPNVELVRGLVPPVLKTIKFDKVALLMIDMNGHEAELSALDFFYEKMVRGGIIYFDDYGGRWSELRSVVDNFFANKPEEILTFVSPNAIVIKK